MGFMIDVDRVEKNPRCADVKLAIILINLICSGFSFLFLLFCMIKMYVAKKILPFLTQIILFIFFCEVMNSISKILQILKYAFRDTRRDLFKDEKTETPRGRICQAQIVISIFSDFGALLGTLLLSYRCIEVIKFKKRHLDKKKFRILSLCGIFLISFIFAIILLIIDINIVTPSFQYDTRDRCSYWCWLSHKTNFICYSFYFILLVSNIILAWRANKHLTESFDKILEKSVVLIDKSDRNDILNDIGDSTGSIEKSYVPSQEDKDRIEKFHKMKFKCRVYPFLTNLIWILSTIYRISDSILNYDADLHSRDDSQITEMEVFKNEDIKNFAEGILVLHTFLSAFRGSLYALCFIIFESDGFFGLFEKCYNFLNCCCFCCKKLNLQILEENETEIKAIERVSNDDDADFRKSNVSDSKNNIDMNTSDYQYND